MLNRRQPRKTTQKRREGREYTASGRLIKIAPATAMRCQITDITTQQPVIFQEDYPGVEQIEVMLEDGSAGLVPGFTSRKRARKVLQKLISVLPPRAAGEPKRYVITNV